VDVRAYRVEADDIVGLAVHELSVRADVPVLSGACATDVLDLASNPVIEKGDVVTVVTDVAPARSAGATRRPEVADERARGVDLEVRTSWSPARSSPA